jgi:hypothetical protein
MKRTRTFSLIFLGMLVLTSVLHIFSADKVNARKSVRLLFRPFLADNDARLVMLRVVANEVRERREIEDGKRALEIFCRILYGHVTKKAELTELKDKGSDYVRLEIRNKELTCTVDLPADDSGYEFVLVRNTLGEKSCAFYLNGKGRQKIGSLFEK